MFSHQCMCFINCLSFQGFYVALAVLEHTLNSGWPRVHRDSPASASRVLWFLSPSFLVFCISEVTHSVFQGVGWRCLWTWWPGSSQGLLVSAVRNVSHHTWLSKLRLSCLCIKVFTPSHFLSSQLLVFRLLARFPTMLFGSFITTEFN